MEVKDSPSQAQHVVVVRGSKFSSKLALTSYLVHSDPNCVLPNSASVDTSPGILPPASTSRRLRRGLAPNSVLLNHAYPQWPNPRSEKNGEKSGARGSPADVSGTSPVTDVSPKPGTTNPKIMCIAVLGGAPARQKFGEG